jgi:hypothetical protein
MLPHTTTQKAIILTSDECSQATNFFMMTTHIT